MKRYVVHLDSNPRGVRSGSPETSPRSRIRGLFRIDEWVLTASKLCCLRCIQTKETNFNSTCICRVPKVQLKEDQNVECVSCGCRGCASSD